VGTLQDITFQKEFEEDLIRKSGIVQRNTLILRQIELARKSGTWQWNVLSNEHIWSEGMFMLLGLQPFSIQPAFENILTYVDLRDRLYVETELVELNAKSDLGLQVLEFRLKIDGETKYIRSTARFNNHPADPFVVGTMTDITDDVILQRELQARTDLIEALVDSSSDIIIALDPEMKIIVWNKNAEKKFQSPREEVLQKSFFEMFPEASGNEEFEAMVRACFRV
jgi:PAS domain-containing protein